MKKRISRFLFLAAAVLAFPFSASAICPVCTVTVCIGIGLSRWLGIDDTVSGLWVGGLIVSLSFWTILWLNKKNIHFPGRNFVVLALFYLLTFLPLCQLGIFGHPQNKIWGIDKLLVGIVLGSFVFLTGIFFHFWLKKKNNEKSFFAYQKVVLPVAGLIFGSLLFYLLTK